ncbi:MAG: helix-turn-helix domain-containing protein [Calditrichaeota bacterium]|nr:helix-turn-helix domain-containing protein [Candidatus Cloacimonadota bacterium]MCA9787140.1 helix-turn-helix domain-containing protein [Candidatus Cloacimonadota bacterium]MCB1045627.1 helix-turn-helix domain-containing protein [Calditrichota bacterium]MCB9474609.1 helix-turn-helix domain-containing protein [Candidatus Delongbacteria bacterium]
MQAFVQELKVAREFRKITLKEIASETMISLSYLTHLENGEWQEVPFPYLRGYLISYAETVGMNLDRVLRNFDELDWKPAEGGRPQTRDLSGPVVRPAGGGGHAELVPPLLALIPMRKKLLVLFAFLLVVAGSFWVVWLFTHTANPADAGQPSFNRTLERVRADQERTNWLQSSMTPRRIQMRLASSGTLKVSSGDSVFFSGTLRADSLLALETTAEITVLVERCEDLSVLLDGAPQFLDSLSGPGEIHLSGRGVRTSPR